MHHSSGFNLSKMKDYPPLFKNKVRSKFYSSLKRNFDNNKKLIVIISLIFTFIFMFSSSNDQNIVNNDGKLEYDAFPYLGGPSIGPNDVLPNPSEKADLLKLISQVFEVPLVDKQHFLRICTFDWSLVKENIYDRQYFATAYRKYVFCFFSRNAIKHLPNIPDIKNLQPTVEAIVHPWLKKQTLGDIPDDTRKAVNSNEKEVLLTGTPVSKDTDLTISFINENLRGRGIVITVSESLIDFFIPFMNHLQNLGSELPIEIYVRKTLSKASYKLIVNRAKTYPGKVSVILLDRFLSREFFPIVTDLDSKAFTLVVSQFDEIITMDLDTIPLVKPEKLFELENYKKSGFYMFQDRYLTKKHTQDQHNFFLSLFPKISQEMWEEYAMYPLKATANRVLRGYNVKYADSGLMILRKSAYLPGLCLTAFMTTWPEFNFRSFDKRQDLFWLGQSVVGNENYYVNTEFGAAIGKTKDAVVNGKDVITVCSGHLAQVDDKSGDILWITRGLDVCRMDLKSKNPMDRVFKFDSLVHVNDFSDAHWVQSIECNGYPWCAVLSPESSSSIISISESKVQEYNKLAQNWVKNHKI